MGDESYLRVAETDAERCGLVAFLQHFAAALGEVTRGAVVECDITELGIICSADFGLAETVIEPAARVEAAAVRDVDRTRDVAAQDDALAPHLGIGHRNGRHERLRVWMSRIAVGRLTVGQLDNSPQVHYGCSIADVL